MEYVCIPVPQMSVVTVHRKQLPIKYSNQNKNPDKQQFIQNRSCEEDYQPLCTHGYDDFSL